MAQAESTTKEAPAEALPHKPAARRRWWILGLRRNWLVDPRSQLRTTLLAALAVGAVLVALLFSLHLVRAREAAAIGAKMPSLVPALEAQNRIDLAFQTAGAAVFLTMVVIVTLLETHKTAGAALRLQRDLARIRDGERGVRTRLRRGDNLQDVASGVNEMSMALDERLWQEIQILQDLAEQARKTRTPEEMARLAEALEDQVAERRRAAGFPDPQPAD
ncbi:MAG: hypothetical protein R3344_04625 [Acidobacteriota bacterium]|nr:hypothetical protein [Acidobacteriota bacterium]